LFYAFPLAEPNKAVCSYPHLNRVLPWSSGCFYSAYFLQGATTEQLEFEHKKLTAFHSRGGVATRVRWYRSAFYRKFNGRFNLSPLELLQIHKEYIEVSPNSIAEVVSWLQYFTDNDSPDIAQNWLYEYCHTYISPNSPYVLVSLQAIINSVDLSVSLTECYDRKNHG
jgi:hypothetical protein